MTDPTICDIFDQMDRDRHLAGYRLEERASPFFEQFLPAVLKCYITDVKLPIIPEFPYSFPYSNNKRTKSPRVDFFALSSDSRCAFFIELKTDMGSLDDGQIKALDDSAKKGMTHIFSELLSIASSRGDKQERQKYFQMLKYLERLHLITEMPPELENLMFDDISTGVDPLLKGIKACGGDRTPKIVYILPEHRDIPRSRVIDFKQFASVVKDCGPLGERFAESLIRWIKRAGSQKPC